MEFLVDAGHSTQNRKSSVPKGQQVFCPSVNVLDAEIDGGGGGVCMSLSEGVPPKNPSTLIHEDSQGLSAKGLSSRLCEEGPSH